MLKAGTQTGSIVNHLYSRATLGQPKAEVGMGATLLLWTDRDPATIIAVEGDGVSPGTIITVQEDNYVRTDTNGFSEDQTYDYSPNPNGSTKSFRLSKKGFWESVRRNPETGRWNKTGSGGIRIGHREKYWDPCF